MYPSFYPALSPSDQQLSVLSIFDAHSEKETKLTLRGLISKVEEKDKCCNTSCVENKLLNYIRNTRYNASKSIASDVLTLALCQPTTRQCYLSKCVKCPIHKWEATGDDYDDDIFILERIDEEDDAEEDVEDASAVAPAVAPAAVAPAAVAPAAVAPAGARPGFLTVLAKVAAVCPLLRNLNERTHGCLNPGQMPRVHGLVWTTMPGEQFFAHLCGGIRSFAWHSHILSNQRGELHQSIDLPIGKATLTVQADFSNPHILLEKNASI